MKILFSSYTFAPNVGGIESVSAILAEKFLEAGHEIELITETEENAHRSTRLRQATARQAPNPPSPSYGAAGAQCPIYKVTRRPSLSQLLGLLGRCDCVFQNNISLRSLIPALLMRKRVIVVHQTWLRNKRGGIGWNNRLKRALLPYVTNVAISEAIRDDLCRATAPVAMAGGAPALQSRIRIIGNPYDSIFRVRAEISRDKTLVFVGRLVSDKGVDLLLQALSILHNENLAPDLTIVGRGPEEEKLRSLARELGLDRHVTFVGQKSGDELARLLNQHRVLVVPSRWAEPFGIVALEGIACACVVVGSRDGGLPEAIGPCGLTFENGNAHACAECLKELLLDPQTQDDLRKEAIAHLAKFRTDTIATAYLELLEEVAH